MAIAVTLDTSQLQPGPYSATLTFNSPNADNAPVQVTITATVTAPQPPCVKADPTELALTGTQGQSTSDSQTVTLTNCGPTGTWSEQADKRLNFDPANGSLDAGATQDVSVSASIANLNPNTYTGDITFTLGASTQVVHVTLTVSAPPAPPGHLDVNPTTLDFGNVQQGQSAQQSLTIGNSGGQALDWTVHTCGCGVITLDTSNGTLQANDSKKITVTLNTSQLQAGSYTGTLTFNSPNADNAPVQVAITVTVTAPPTQTTVNPTTLAFSSSSVFRPVRRRP